MKVALLFNHSSGRRVPLGSLRQLIVREGHELVRVIEHREDARRLADPPADLVVAAGGDGTIAQAIDVIAGRGVPLAVLPLGTANNIAFTLGIGGPLEHIARDWHRANARPLDVGVLRAGDETRRFVEGVGGGLVEACMASIRDRPMPYGEPPPWLLVRALRRYAGTLGRLQPQRWSVAVDGRNRSGDYLVFEVLNMRAVGPNLEFAPGSSPSDGALTVVSAVEADRDALAAYIEDRLAGRASRLALTTETARCVRIQAPPPLHVDDALAEPDGPLSIGLEPGAITVLTAPQP